MQAGGLSGPVGYRVEPGGGGPVKGLKKYYKSLSNLESSPLLFFSLANVLCGACARVKGCASLRLVCGMSYSLPSLSLLPARVAEPEQAAARLPCGGHQDPRHLLCRALAHRQRHGLRAGLERELCVLVLLQRVHEQGAEEEGDVEGWARARQGRGQARPWTSAGQQEQAVEKKVASKASKASKIKAKDLSWAQLKALLKEKFGK